MRAWIMRGRWISRCTSACTVPTYVHAYIPTYLLYICMSAVPTGLLSRKTRPKLECPLGRVRIAGRLQRVRQPTTQPQHHGSPRPICVSARSTAAVAPRLLRHSLIVRRHANAHTVQHPPGPAQVESPLGRSSLDFSCSRHSQPRAAR